MNFTGKQLDILACWVVRDIVVTLSYMLLVTLLLLCWWWHLWRIRTMLSQ